MISKKFSKKSFAEISMTSLILRLLCHGSKRKKDCNKKHNHVNEYTVGKFYDFGLLRPVFICVCLTLCLNFAGCCSNGLDKPHIVNFLQEAASVHVSALSVCRWEECFNSLQPQFTITPDQALLLALPKTSISQNSIADILSAGLQVGLAQSTQSSSLTQALTQGLTSGTGYTRNAGTSTSNSTTTANGNTTNNASSSNTGGTTTTSTTTSNGNQSTTQTTTIQQGPGTLPPNLLPSATLPNAAAATTPSGTLQLDPLLTYAAATAIYQEVQLLNIYVKDAVLRYGYIPYLARIQVSTIPYAHNEPYDVYINLGIFSRCRNQNYVEKPVVVIPLLVTDDVETGQTTNALNIARQLALSLGGIVSNVALQAGLSDLKDQFKAILGTDFNSLYMVTRASDNVVQVRLGAARNPNLNVGYGMLTQTHNVSLLLLVDHNYSPDDENGLCFSISQEPQEKDSSKKAGPEVLINTFSRIRNAITGEELPTNRSLISNQTMTVMRRFVDPSEEKNLYSNKKDIEKLLIDMQNNNMDEFKQDYCLLLGIQNKICENFVKKVISLDDIPVETKLTYKKINAYAKSLWIGLTTVLNMSEYAGTLFELPKKQEPTVDRTQTVFLHDNCKDSTTATISGFGTLSPNQFMAGLTLKNKITLAATAITQSTPGGPFTLQFPSLRSFGESSSAIRTACPDPSTAGAKNSDLNPAPANQLDEAQLTVKEVIDKRWNVISDSTGTSPYDLTFTSLYLDGKTQPNTNIILIPAVDTITADATGKSQILRLFLTTKGLDDIVLSFNGATLATPLPNNAQALEKSPQPAASLIVTLSTDPDNSTTVVDVSLQGLVATRTVTITAVGRKIVVSDGKMKPKPVVGAMSVISIPVNALSNPKPSIGVVSTSMSP